MNFGVKFDLGKKKMNFGVVKNNVHKFKSFLINGIKSLNKITAKYLNLFYQKLV